MAATRWVKTILLGAAALAGALAPNLAYAVAESQSNPPGRSGPDIRVALPPVDFPDWEPTDSEFGVVEYAARFRSAVESAEPANNWVPVRAVLPARRDGPVPAVIILHYWGARDQRFERNLGVGLARRGVGAVLIALPYHLDRTPPGARSGERAIVPDPEALVATMAQAVLDVRRSVDWIQSRPEFRPDAIGLAGASLGAIVAATAVGVEPRIDTAAFLLGGADLGGILWHSSRVVRQRESLRRAGWTEERLRQALEPVEPSRFLADRRPGRSFVIAARNDTVVPPANAERLIRSLGDPTVLWLDTGHYGGFFVLRQVQREIIEFFEAEFSGRTYVPPAEIRAPVVRIGAHADSANGLQVAAGIDIWRALDRPGEVMGTALFTPRGPALFVGARIERGLSLGVSFRPNQVTGGLFWSIVL
ncbi:MAG: hypothetical protein SNJ74_03250 [Fimbriimonadaceae bacterium]